MAKQQNKMMIGVGAIAVFSILLLSILVFLSVREYQEYEDGLKLHPKINRNDVEEMVFIHKSGKETPLSDEDQKKLIKWLNRYPNSQVSEEHTEDILPEAAIKIRLKDKYTISVLYSGNGFYASEYYNGNYIIGYAFLDEIKPLKQYFQKTLD
ncbi:MAG: hypothetical protein ACI35R_01825 [Bacillus sp. (in: firmicutes)]